MAKKIFNSPIVRKIWEKRRLIWRRGRVLSYLFPFSTVLPFVKFGKNKM